MKIIALLPVKNEAWILPTFLSSVKKIADEILALDDNSRDDSVKILLANGAKILSGERKPGEIQNMSRMRMRLLAEGRKMGGTHFIWLDSDETFSGNFIANARDVIASLKPGQKLLLRWIALWKSPRQYRDDQSVWSNAYRDFAVCDRPEYSFLDKNLSEDRTQGTSDIEPLKLPVSAGAVLHFQFCVWEKFQIKQAWYRCQELLKNPRNPFSINYSYAITLDDPEAKTSPVPPEWLAGLALPEDSGKQSAELQIEEIFSLFDQCGIEFFEPLEIWHIPELKNEFVKRVGREPKPLSSSSKILKLVNWLKYAPRKKISRLAPPGIKNFFKKNGK